MSIHNHRYSVQLIKIATWNKRNFEKIPRFWRFKQLCARHSYVCRHGLYVVYIVTQTPSFRRSRDLDKSNKFRQMQELTNDYYSEIKLHNILHIRPLNLVLIKKNQQLHSRSQYWNDNEAATEVRSIILKSTNASCDLDPFPTRLLKHYIDYLIVPITAIINLSMRDVELFHMTLNKLLLLPLLKRKHFAGMNLRIIVQYLTSAFCQKYWRKL